MCQLHESQITKNRLSSPPELAVTAARRNNFPSHMTDDCRIGHSLELYTHFWGAFLICRILEINHVFLLPLPEPVYHMMYQGLHR